MGLVLDGPPAPDVLQLSWDLCSAVGARHFLMDRGTGQSAIELAGARTPGIGVRPGEMLWHEAKSLESFRENTYILQVNLATEYYGIGHEQGDLMTILATAEFCEFNLKCEVYYGGAAKETPLEQFTQIRRRQLLDYYQTRNPFPYPNYVSGQFPFGRPPRCKLCPKNGNLEQVELFHNNVEYYCPGCDVTITTRDGGESWSVI